MADLVREVVAEVDRLADELVELCRALIRINTVNPYAGVGITGFERDGQAFLEPILEGMGGSTRLFEPPPDVYDRVGMIGPKGRSWRGRPNLVTEFDLGPGKCIIINSHMDTVDVDGMRFDPFAADVEDGKIYGRGASDDKGGMAAGVIAIKAVLKFADALSGRIVHESVVDEECSGGGAGTLACCIEGYRGDAAIVVDGAGLTVMRGCQGCLTADVHVAGKAGHAALGGVNAIDKACLIKAALDRFKRDRETADPGCLVNLGVFKGGSHPAVVPGAAVLSYNVVYAVAEAAANERAGRGWNGASVRDAFVEAVRAADESDAFLREHPSRVDWIKDLVPFETPADAPVVEAFCRACEDVMSGPAAADVLKAWGDAANTARYGGTPSIFFGTGTPGAAHAPDETVRIADLVTGAKALAVYLCRELARGGAA
ncbi:MAG: M20/M25/M40 family metallo-hydrolase [Candidatus Hydrogenedentes bacterium]|nr:M20/M25/M40 family metallo-hydrolase [Candidatus Hydrogenedentota bacterium]